MVQYILIMKTKISLFLVAFLTVTLAFSQEKKWTLKECVDYALENNLSVKRNKLNLETNEVNVKDSRSNFLPTLDASTGGNLGFGSIIDPVTNNRLGSTSSFSGSAGANTSINVFNGFRNSYAYKQAKLGIETGKLDLMKMQNDISLNVVDAYLNVLFAKENLNVAKTQFEISSKQIERAKSQVEAGTKPRADLLNIESTVANDEQNIITTENALNLALLRLSQLLQIPSDSFDVASIIVDSPSVSLLYDNATTIYEKALQNMPEIKRANLDLKNAELAIKRARGGYLPTVSASAGLGSNYFFNLKNSQGRVDLFKQLNNNLGYNAGFSVNVPIFSAFRNKNNVTRNKINKGLSELNLENQKLQLRQTIEQAFLDAKAAAKAYNAAQKSLVAQKEAFKNAQERYNYGAMTMFDFDQVRNRLVNAESALIRAKYDYVFKTKVLKFYNGEPILE